MLTGDVDIAERIVAALVDRLRHLVPAMRLSADSDGGQAATIGWDSSEPVAPLGWMFRMGPSVAGRCRVTSWISDLWRPKCCDRNWLGRRHRRHSDAL